MAATTWIPVRSIPLPSSAGPDGAGSGGRRAVLQALPATRVRRRFALVGAALVLAGATTAALLLAAPAVAGPEAPAGVGHVVLAPGESLWDVAVRTARPGVDPRAQFRDLMTLNGLDPALAPAPWTVLTLPPR